MPTSAVALALGAAVLHAVWNMRLARAADTEAATAVTLAAGVLLLTLPALLTWRVDAAAWPYVAGSCAFEIGYIVTLAAGLRRGDLSVVYPLARGSAPVLVLAVSAGVLGAATSAWQVSGVLLVAAGVLLVRGLRRPADPWVIALALACGACIAGYTLVDARGIEHAAAMPYLWVVLAVTALVYVPLVARWRGGRGAEGGAGLGHTRHRCAVLRRLSARPRGAAARRARPRRRRAREQRRDRGRTGSRRAPRAGDGRTGGGGAARRRGRRGGRAGVAQRRESRKK